MTQTFVDNGQIPKILTINMRSLLFVDSTLNCRIIYIWLSFLNDQY